MFVWLRRLLERLRPETAAPILLHDRRCSRCRRLLCKSTRDALRPGAIIELKCGKCKAFVRIEADIGSRGTS